MSVEVSIICDGCALLGGAGQTAVDVREQLRRLGWRTALPGGRDLCPDCAERPAASSSSRGGDT